MVDDYWATAVKLFTGYPMPDRSTLFTNLTGDGDHGKIPMINVTIEQVEFSMSTTGGPDIDGHDYVIPFYNFGTDGSHASSKTKPTLRRALIDFVNAGGQDIKHGDVTNSVWGDADDAALDGSALGQYISGSAKALEALAHKPYSTQGLKVSGGAVADASAVDLHTFSDTAKSFDRVATFFGKHADTLQQWKDSLGKEQSAWKGKAAGVFWHLLDTVHKNYDEYSDQMHPKGFTGAHSEVGGYTTVSKQGDALIDAENSLLAELRELSRINGQWHNGVFADYQFMAEDPTMQYLTGIANPYAIVYSLLSEVERWAATHNRTQVTMTTSKHITYVSGYMGNGVPITETNVTYGAGSDYKENFPGFGNLSVIDTWRALGNKAVERWNEGVDDHLVPPAKTSLSNVNNAWIRAQQVLDKVVTTKSNATLSSSYETDSAGAGGGGGSQDDINKLIKEIQDDANKAINDANKAAKEAIDEANRAAQDAIDKANQEIKDLQAEMKKELQEGQDEAKKAIDDANKAAKEAQDEANQAIKDAQDQANAQIKQIQDEANQQIKELQDELNGSTTTTDGGPPPPQDETLSSQTDGPVPDTTLRSSGQTDTSQVPDPTGLSQFLTSSMPPPVTTTNTTGSTTGSTTGGPGGVTVRNSDGSSTTTFPDGSEVTTSPNGSVTTTGPDGSTTTVGPDGTTTVRNPDGTVTTTQPDGTSFTRNPNGSTTVTDGSGTSTTVDPDGSTTVTDPSGTTTTTNPDGTTTVTDPSGTITSPGGGSTTRPPVTTTPPPESATPPPFTSTPPPVTVTPPPVTTTPHVTTSPPVTRPPVTTTHVTSHATTPDGYSYDDTAAYTGLGTPPPGNAFTGGADPFGAAGGPAGSALTPFQNAAAAQSATTTGSTTSSPSMMPPMGGGGAGGGGRGDDSQTERVRNSGTAVLGRASGGGTSPRGGRPLDEEEEEVDEVTTAGAPFVPAGAASGQGGQATQSGDRERSAWLTEEEDVWGTEEGTTPAVIGR